MLISKIAVTVVLAIGVHSYIPASPTNSTRDAIAGGLNVTDISRLHLQWYSNGSYSEHVSYQLVGNGSSGISKGVLVHFSEDKATNLTAPTTTPWIALVSCDRNSTDASMDEDIFTLARDKGAVSALLYSLYSVACVINPEYSDPATFDQVFDIFSTQSLTSAHLIEYQFGQLGTQSKSIFAYDSLQLNNSGSDIQRSINMSYPVSPGYLLAVLQAYNATGDNSDPSINGGTAGSTDVLNSSSPNTALAMIILYAITGCVSALFCVVIISGAIRAIRHPERYGPRARLDGDGGPPQSRARGLTRAILDTFPIVKFGNTQVTSQQDSPQAAGEKDTELQAPRSNIEMEIMPNSKETSSPELPCSIAPGDSYLYISSSAGLGSSQPTENATPIMAEKSVPSSHFPSPGQGDTSGSTSRQSHDVGEGCSRDTALAASNRPDHDDVVPPSIGRDTCPICIVDFEEGDDIRVLPCEGKHCFHQQCVDPWLLKLSSSCPICRHDFLALESMLSGHSDDEEEEMDHRMPHPRGHDNGGRFSRYLRFAHHRERRRRGEETDPTDPYMPTAPMYSGM